MLIFRFVKRCLFLLVLSSVGSVFAEVVGVAVDSVNNNPAEVMLVLESAIAEDSHNIKNSSFITADDIAASPATQLVELLAREANVHLRTLTGNDKYGGIDIRGMGATSSSNVLILVDGVRLNNADLSGADLSAIPLAQIERIEIVRGGGAVRYGNGAVGGVVNIVTRGEGHQIEISAHKGSWDTEEFRVDYQDFRGDKFRVKASASLYDTDGYRDNGDLQKKDAMIETEFLPVPDVSLSLLLKHHRDKFGLPGDITLADYDRSKSARRATDVPHDGGETDEDLSRFEITYSPGEEFNWSSAIFYREREINTILNYSPIVSKEDQLFSIEDRRYGIESMLDWFFSGKRVEQEFGVGFEYQQTNYQQYRNGRTVLSQSEQKPGDLEHYGVFADWALYKGPFKLQAGMRNDWTYMKQEEKLYERDCIFNPFPVLQCTEPEYRLKKLRRESWRHQVWELGYTVDIGDDWIQFASYSKSFRNPNLDELVLSDEDLGPQKGGHGDIGIRFDNGRWGVSLTVFYMETKDEILFGVDPVSKLAMNRNADQVTRRSGAELDVSWLPTDAAKLWLKAGYVEAHFSETGAFIPLVPRKTATAGFDWNVRDDLLFGLTVSYAGERYDGNDFTNKQYRELDAYLTVDAKLSYRYDNWEIYVSGMNLTNEIYATSAYSEGYYPMPSRHLMAGIKCTF